jgi:TrmH family RNA methyltransferase
MRGFPATKIQSLQNPWVKEIRKAVRKGTLTDSGRLVAEGTHLYEEARRSGLGIQAVFTTEEMKAGIEGATLVPESLMREMSSLERPAGLIALVEAPPPRNFGEGLVVVLDAIQDPGNAGTILRTAEAFGVAGVVALRGTVDLFGPKVLRASAGSAFRLPLRRGVVWSEWERGNPVYAAVSRGGVPPEQVDWGTRAILVVGNEGAGVADEISREAALVSIATERVESLNAAAAAAILIYEATRRLRA